MIVQCFGNNKVKLILIFCNRNECCGPLSIVEHMDGIQRRKTTKFGRNLKIDLFEPMGLLSKPVTRRNPLLINWKNVQSTPDIGIPQKKTNKNTNNHVHLKFTIIKELDYPVVLFLQPRHSIFEFFFTSLGNIKINLCG